MPAVAQACLVCYQKKMRCDMATGKQPCSNCLLYNVECRPRLRKRKRGQSISHADVPDSSLREMSKQPELTDEVQSAPVQARAGGSSNSILSLTPHGISSILWNESSLENEPGETEREHERMLVTATSNPTDPTRPTSSEQHQTSAQSLSNGLHLQAAPESRIHDGRVIYFANMEGNDVEMARAYPRSTVSSLVELQTLRLIGAYDLPPRGLRDCWIDNFFQYCSPWVPIVEPNWLKQTPTHRPSLLLIQATLFAGSRVTAPMDGEASNDLYAKARALFFSGYEQNSIVLITACLLLQWWNPVGPERISLDSSSFWNRTAIFIAHQIGLHKEVEKSKDSGYRRRLWWTLMARDSQISTAHGRPRAINVEDSNVSFVSPLDFRAQDPNIHVSINFMAICKIFGEIGETCRRGRLTEGKRASIRNDLYLWVRELPANLRLHCQNSVLDLNPYHFGARQLHILYFVIIAILYRSPPASSSPSTASIVASSFVAGIFEDFLIRDQICFLGPGIYKFCLLSAGVTLLSASRINRMRMDNSADLTSIKASLKEFAKRYPSALGTLKALETLTKSLEEGKEMIDITPQTLIPEAQGLFREFGPPLCRMFYLVENSKSTEVIDKERHELQDSLHGEVNPWGHAPGVISEHSEARSPSTLSAEARVMSQSEDVLSSNNFDLYDIGQSSNWLGFSDQDSWLLEDWPMGSNVFEY